MPNNRFTTRLLDIIASPSFDEDEPYLFLVMDLMSADMIKFLDSSSDFDLKEVDVKQILYRLLCSLNYLHSANIMHRDLKPANILVGEDLSIKICDFGLARAMIPKQTLISDSSSRTSVAEELKINLPDKKKRKRALSRHVATRWYRSPELVLLEKEYDGSADVWSVGCILQEMIFSSHSYRVFNKKKSKRILFKADSCYPLSPS